MARATSPKRLKRSESFLGIHFDFHAGDTCRTIGKDVTPKMIQAIIDAVHPDYIQCDCKGHPGFSSYKTKVGHPAPGLVKDQLKVWREVTAKNGVALYMHYSGVFDTQAIKHHPSWARIDEKGKRDPQNTSVFGPYVDELLIPQMKELCDVYGVDGMWVDGECWATCQDYHKNVLKAFRQKTGIKAVPRKPEDPYFYEFTEFCRQGFRDYLKHYVDIMHAHNPDFQIASNWAYSSFMPEKPTVDVDYISGDYPLINSVNAARFEARCMSRQGKPWDLMAWSFVSRWKEGVFSTKTPVQLQQEAAIVLAMGGGFQAYFTQNKDASVALWKMDVMKETAAFCRARQQVCHHAEQVPQIALLNSAEDYYRRNARIFSPWDGVFDRIKGNLCCLLDSQYSVEVLSEHHLTGCMSDYPVIVVAECGHLTAAFKKELIAYVKQGGELLVLGVQTAKLFKKELGLKISAKKHTAAGIWLEAHDWLAGLKTDVLNVQAAAGKILSRYYARDDKTAPRGIAASVRKLGKGQIAGIYCDLGEGYWKRRTSVARDFLGMIVGTLFPNPLVEVQGSHHVDVCINRKDGRLMINLVNTGGPHGDEDVYVFDEIPVLGPLEVTIRMKKSPKRIVLQPENKPLKFTHARGQVHLTLPRLHVHEILQVEE